MMQTLSLCRCLRIKEASVALIYIQWTVLSASLGLGREKHWSFSCLRSRNGPSFWYSAPESLTRMIPCRERGQCSERDPEGVKVMTLKRERSRIVLRSRRHDIRAFYGEKKVIGVTFLSKRHTFACLLCPKRVGIFSHLILAVLQMSGKIFEVGHLKEEASDRTLMAASHHTGQSENKRQLRKKHMESFLLRTSQRNSFLWLLPWVGVGRWAAESLLSNACNRYKIYIHASQSNDFGSSQALQVRWQRHKNCIDYNFKAIQA